MKHLMIIGVEPYSLINFNGPLLKALVSKGIKVTTLSLPLTTEQSNLLQSWQINHISIHFQRTGMNPWQDLKTCYQLWRTIRQHQPDAVFAYTIKPVIWGGIASRLLGIPFVPQITGLGYAFQPGNWKRRLLTNLVSRLYAFATQKSKQVIFLNRDNLDIFLSRGDIQPNQGTVVDGSGIDTERFPYVTPTPTEPIVFLCIARLLTEKGLREYAQAAALVKAQFPTARFQLLGPEDLSPDAIPMTEVQQWVQNGWIEYLGATNDVRPYLAACHVYVLPSYHEGVPQSTQEAMATGRPILTTTAPGCKETVTDGLNGFMVPVKDIQSLADKMVWFVENPDVMLSMGQASRAITEQRFDVRIINQKTIDIIKAAT